MFPVGLKVDFVLWLAEMSSYTRIRRKFNQVHPKQRAPIYRSTMRWDKRLKETGSVMSRREELSIYMVHHLNYPIVFVPVWTGSFLIILCKEGDTETLVLQS